MFCNIKRWTLIRRSGAKVYQLRYILNDGTVRERSTRETVRRQAEKRAMEILGEVEESGALEVYGWLEFCVRYEAEHLSGKPFKTIEAFRSASSRFDQLCPVRFVSDITSQVLVQFAVRLRSEGKSEATIQAYRDHLMSALRWAEDVSVISKRPKPPRLKRIPSGTRGRPLSEEEFERMLGYLPEVVGEDYASRWEWNLRGLWLSGLRLGESLKFFWGPTFDGHHIVDLDSNRPKIQIDQFSEKAFCNRLLPMTPDFAQFLRQVAGSRRNGLVFKWPLSRGYSESVKTIGKRISLLGTKAKVVTGKGKTASAHDLRRTFGSRWSTKVQPFVLRTLMRHSSITTTERFYVGCDVDRISEALYAAGDTGLEPAAPCGVSQFQ